MVDLETLKGRLEEFVAESKATLAVDGYFRPILLAIHGDQVSPIVINRLDGDEDKEDLASLMRELSKGDDCDALVFTMDALYRVMDKNANIPHTLEGDDEAKDMLVTFLYTREKTLMRQVIYSKRAECSYNFFDIGWQDMTEMNGRFSNPFQSDRPLDERKSAEN